MLLNFYLDENLQTGKEIINSFLANDTTKFISNFRDVVFEAPDPNDRSATTRFNRRVLFYRALLFKAGYTPPSDLRPQTHGLFRAELFTAMRNGQGKDSAAYANCSAMLCKTNPTWGEVAQCGQILRSEEHTSELQSQSNLVCRLLLEKKNIYSRATFLQYAT